MGVVTKVHAHGGYVIVGVPLYYISNKYNWSSCIYFSCKSHSMSHETDHRSLLYKCNCFSLHKYTMISSLFIEVIFLFTQISFVALTFVCFESTAFWMCLILYRVVLRFVTEKQTVMGMCYYLTRTHLSGWVKISVCAEEEVAADTPVKQM